MPPSSPVHHYGAAPAIAELRDLIEVDRFALEAGFASQHALDCLAGRDDGEFLEYARQWSPSQADELSLMMPVTPEDHDRMLGLLLDVAAMTQAALERGATARGETGGEHYRRSPESFRVVAEVPRERLCGWLGGTGGTSTPARAAHAVAPRTAPRARGAGRPKARAARSSAASGDSGGDDPPGPASRPEVQQTGGADDVTSRLSRIAARLRRIGGLG